MDYGHTDKPTMPEPFEPAFFTAESGSNRHSEALELPDNNSENLDLTSGEWAKNPEQAREIGQQAMENIAGQAETSNNPEAIAPYMPEGYEEPTVLESPAAAPDSSALETAVNTAVMKAKKDKISPEAKNEAERIVSLFQKEKIEPAAFTEAVSKIRQAYVKSLAGEDISDGGLENAA